MELARAGLGIPVGATAGAAILIADAASVVVPAALKESPSRATSSSRADWYRCDGSFCSAFKITFSRPSAMRGLIELGGTGG